MVHGTMAQKMLSKDERMQWWREARFGMFIHWGVYAVPQAPGTDVRSEDRGMIMNRGKIPVAIISA